MSFFEKTTTSQAIADYLLTQIQNGEFNVGDKLPTERELAEQLGVSRISVREALSGLSMIGILESRQGAGSYVSGYNANILGRAFYAFAVLEKTPLADIIVVRRALEAECAKYAALNSTDEELSKLHDILAAYDEALLLEPNSRMFKRKIQELDFKFHSGVAASSHQSYLIQILSTVTASFQVLHAKSYEEDEDFGLDAAVYFQQLHKQLMVALEDRNPESAYNIMYAHLTGIEKIIIG